MLALRLGSSVVKRQAGRLSVARSWDISRPSNESPGLMSKKRVDENAATHQPVMKGTTCLPGVSQIEWPEISRKRDV
jgi:hypothetical protein